MSGMKRRNFLRFMLAGGAASLVDCTVRAPSTPLVSNVNSPEELIPGKSLYYASICRECPAGCGVHVCTRDGRVVKIEGNPRHPVNRGALCARGQASPQALYDPDRITQPLQRSGLGSLEPVGWEEALDSVAKTLTEVREDGDSEALVFMSGALGPTFSTLASGWLAALGAGRLLQYEAFGYEFLKSANQLTFGKEEVPYFALDKASLILSLGADFVETWLSPVEFSRAFSTFRTYHQGRIGRFVQVESRLSLTGANADDWILIRPATEHAIVLALVHVILAERLTRVENADFREIEKLVAAFDPDTVSRISGTSSDVIYSLARSFAQERPSVALFGGVASTAAHATATQVGVNLLNYVVGNIGETVIFGADLYPHQLSRYQEILQLVDDMNAGKVKLLMIHQSNPAFTLPFETGFQKALEEVPLVVAFSHQLDETASRADLVLPTHTPLEAWDDYSPRAGIRGLQQPAMQPLHDSRHAGDLLFELGSRVSEPVVGSGGTENYYEFLREQWKELQIRERPELDFESFWKMAAMGGGVWKEFPAQSPLLGSDWKDLEFESPLMSEDSGEKRLVLIPYPSIFHFDGRGANKAWLQEAPQPLTDIVWDSFVEIHPETAEEFELRQGDTALLRSPYGEIQLPVFLSPWIHPEAVAVPLGQGHTHCGRYARGRGANAADLLGPTPEANSGGMPWLSVRLTVEKANVRQQVVSTRGELSQGEREIAQSIPLAEVARASREKERGEGTGQLWTDLYPPHPHPEHQWGMVIDLNACTGCRACVVACYAENNIPVVGKEGVAWGREMSWIRIESYTEEEAVPNYIFLPMLCQHCHQAPCESVCPVFATYHSPEGLNAQIYNRCVGTRYCANNCPYKARRFNYHKPQFPQPLDRQLNPNVTVRVSGIMEKCTFCVQRIVEAKQWAEEEGRRLKDGDVVPACVQTCPTKAIVFGDFNDPESQVSERSKDARAYHVLEHLGTNPAVTYLRRIRRRMERS